MLRLNSARSLHSSHLVECVMVAALVRSAEFLTINRVGRVRREVVNGHLYLIAPMTLIVPGVLNGSQGRLFYPMEEIKRNYWAWNNTPIVVNHPFDEFGRPISGRKLHVLAKYGIGFIRNASVEGGKLSCEGWFDANITRNAEPRIYKALIENKAMEISTGLLTDNEPVPSGTHHNGLGYDFIARNYGPDHLAVLPDQKGACSLDDGCGLNINAKDALGHGSDKRGEEWPEPM